MTLENRPEELKRVNESLKHLSLLALVDKNRPARRMIKTTNNTAALSQEVFKNSFRSYPEIHS